MMETMDETVGMILDKLDELGLADDTIVIFTSDNGGLHVLEGLLSPATHNGPFRAGKGFLYEGGTRVPLIVRWPGRVPAGKVEDTPVIEADWLPTFVELAGGKAAKGPLDGVSLAGLLQGKKLTPRPLYWHMPHYTNQGSQPSGSMRDGDWVLIEHYEDGKLELFNLARDIGQTKNLANAEPERTAQMKDSLAKWRKEVGAQQNKLNPNFDPAWHKKLYVDMDVSSVKPAATAAETAKQMQEWRQGMIAVLQKKKN
jgi:arylsulfatase A